MFTLGMKPKDVLEAGPGREKKPTKLVTNFFVKMIMLTIFSILQAWSHFCEKSRFTSNKTIVKFVNILHMDLALFSSVFHTVVTTHIFCRQALFNGFSLGNTYRREIPTASEHKLLRAELLLTCRCDASRSKKTFTSHRRDFSDRLKFLRNIGVNKIGLQKLLFVPSIHRCTAAMIGINKVLRSPTLIQLVSVSGL